MFSALLLLRLSTYVAIAMLCIPWSCSTVVKYIRTIAISDRHYRHDTLSSLRLVCRRGIVLADQQIFCNFTVLHIRNNPFYTLGSTSQNVHHIGAKLLIIEILI